MKIQIAKASSTSPCINMRMGDPKAWVYVNTVSLRGVPWKLEIQDISLEKSISVHSIMVKEATSEPRGCDQLETDPELLAKLQLWQLTKFSKVVFLDPNVAIFESLENLFDRPGHPLTAGYRFWPSTWFSSSLMVVTPQQSIFNSIAQNFRRLQDGSPDCSADSILNEYFINWNELDVAHRLDFRFITHQLWVYKTEDLPPIALARKSLFAANTLSVFGNPKNRTLDFPWIDEWHSWDRALAYLIQAYISNPAKIRSSLDSSSLGLYYTTPTRLNYYVPSNSNPFPRQAYVTFIQDNIADYTASAEVLIESIRTHASPNSRRQIIAMITQAVEPIVRQRLQLAGYEIREVPSIRNPLSECTLSKWKGNEQNSVWSKLQVFGMDEFDKVSLSERLLSCLLCILEQLTHHWIFLTSGRVH
jgi:alpha-N-acetylglucosamine transferase